MNENKKTMSQSTKNVSKSVCIFKLRCDERFTHAFTARGCVFREITLVGSNQGNYFENATACSKRTLKTIVAIIFRKQNHGFILTDNQMI
jgi:hypothetical protein